MEGLIALGVSFDSLGLDRRICKALRKQGFEHPTLVQEKAIPLALQGKDILARAKTGSGKTAAYAIPVIQKILLAKKAPGAKKGVRCAILLPTRELCAQVTQVVESLTAYCKGLITTVDLGVEAEEGSQSAMLRDKPDIIVTTPSRLLTFLKEKMIDLKICFDSVVVDEADLTLSLGYETDIQGIIPYLPKVYQGYLMSATLDDRTKGVRDVLLHNAVTLHLKDAPTSLSAPELLTENLVRCSSNDKFLVVYSLLRLGLIPHKVLIFVNSVDKCIQLKLFLDRFTIQSTVLNAELPRESRLHIIKQFNEGVFNFLIATDGLIDDLGLEEEDQLDEEHKFVDDSKRATVEEIHDVDAESNNKPKKNKKTESDGEESDEENTSMAIKEEGEDDDVQVSKSNGKAKKVKKEEDADIKSEVKDEDDEDEDDDEDAPPKKKHRKAKKEEEDTEYSVARGVDFKGVQTVINFDFPQSTKAYIHRIGRTARGGAKGLAISLISPDDEEALNKVVRKRNKTIPEFGFQMQSVASFRYRCEDVIAGITPHQVKLARAEMIRKEISTSKKLKRHFQANPQEKLMLKNAHVVAAMPLSAAKRHTLRNIPNYLVPKSLVANVNQNNNENLTEKKRKFGKKKQDPLLSRKKK